MKMCWRSFAIAQTIALAVILTAGIVQNIIDERNNQ